MLAIHDEQLSEHGGASGGRDEGALESALARPENLLAYEEASLLQLAAAYTYGLARNDASIDGNKRTSAVVTELFLALKGMSLVASDEELVLMWLAIAVWLEQHLVIN